MTDPNTVMMTQQAQETVRLCSKPPASAMQNEYRELSMRFVQLYKSADHASLIELSIRIRELKTLIAEQSTLFGA